MDNVQHIFIGVGDPNLLSLITVDGIHHYKDSGTGDIWLGDSVGGWELIYQGGSNGNIAFYYEDASTPTINPKGPAICQTGNGFFILDGGGEWVQLALHPLP